MDFSLSLGGRWLHPQTVAHRRPSDSIRKHDSTFLFYCTTRLGQPWMSRLLVVSEVLVACPECWTIKRIVSFGFLGHFSLFHEPDNVGHIPKSIRYASSHGGRAP